jgi:UDP-N-acetylglucosamine/UDP-N-acetylgalactosamine diphosphorylase
VPGDRPDPSNFQQVRDHYEAHGQGHVFHFWDALDDAGRERLARQAAGIDLPALLRAHASLGEAHAGDFKLETLPIEALPEHGGDAERARQARERGEALLGSGRVAVMVVAGGQASRLGYGGPKGFFPIGPLSDRCLFAQQAQKLTHLRARCGRPVPWYIMTSPATDAATRDGFARADSYGLPPEDVFFLSQGMVPSLDFDGRLMLERPDRIFENPNGHGGAITALLDSGALDDMASRGVDTIFYYQVDNPLVPLADSLFLGFHALAGAEMSCKVIRKIDPAEKMGVVARVNGRVGVVEYTEIDDEQRYARDTAGDLVYWAGNLAVHAFDTAFVRRVADHADSLLPFHASAKKIPALDDEGQALSPDEPNGHKLERFVFDALAAARSVCVVEARRSEEYSPVKNAEGSDSPVTARRDLVALYRTWLADAGVEVPPPGTAIEIDESRISGCEDLRRLGIRSVEEAGDIVHTARGVEA